MYGILLVSDPLTLTHRSNLRVVADDFAIYRQDALKKAAADTYLHSLERIASAAGLFYHKKTGNETGNIGSFGYGAGVAMSTADALSVAGGRVGRGAYSLLLA